MSKVKAAKEPPALSAQQEVLSRAKAAWGDQVHWGRLYDEAARFAIPQRNPGGPNSSRNDGAEVMDMTSTQSALYFAGQLQRSLFPTGQPPFMLTPGAVAQANLAERELQQLKAALRKVEKPLLPFFLNGEFSTAMHEMCIDLAFGTGALLVHPGQSPNQPLRFACIPLGELAIECDLFGDVVLVSWKRSLTKRQIRQAFPNGKFPDEYGEGVSPGTDVLEQVFWRKDLGRHGYRWGFLAAASNGHVIEEAEHKHRRIAVPRYYRVPGEAYGRGPLLLALPSIKTLNKAQELAFRSAAIQMLGIWAYRANGTVNPDTLSIDAGAFWPMQSTGGMLGPDVQRMDSASGSLNVGYLIIGNLQDQIRGALFDERLKPAQGTPASAQEIVARVRQQADVHIGAFGRLVREIMPVIVPAAFEILAQKGLTAFRGEIDEMMIGLEVRSPMAAALNAERVEQAVNFFQIVASIDPENMDLHVAREALLAGISELMQIDSDWVPTADQKEKVRDAQQAAQAAALAMQMAQQAQGGGANDAGAQAMQGLAA